MGGSTENSALAKTTNPWNIDCVPGGSSGGSAAAVPVVLQFGLSVLIQVAPFVNQPLSVA